MRSLHIVLKIENEHGNFRKIPCKSFMKYRFGNFPSFITPLTGLPHELLYLCYLSNWTFHHGWTSVFKFKFHGYISVLISHIWRKQVAIFLWVCNFFLRNAFFHQTFSIILDLTIATFPLTILLKSSLILRGQWIVTNIPPKQHTIPVVVVLSNDSEALLKKDE